MNETVMNLTSAYMERPLFIFSWIDYTIFVIMLGVSVTIGVYYAFFGTKQTTTNEYLFGGKTMKIFPVSMSIITSNISGVAILSITADIYVYGATYLFICIPYLLNGILCSYVFLPVFLKLEINSVYDYLNLRFNNKIRLLSSSLFVISVILMSPIGIYIPSLAFAQVTGINLHLISGIASIVCVFYTALGGLKAVIWTDTIQTITIFGSMVVVLGIGISESGGIPLIWQKSLEGHRLDVFDFQVDLTKRDTVWAPIIGGITSHLSSYAVAQVNIQKLMSVPSLASAKKVVFISVIGIVLVKQMIGFIGIMIFAKYSDCDPLKTAEVTKNDQLLPYYVTDVAGKIPGLPGLFIAGVFSAGLSMLSSKFNALPGVVYQNFIFPFMPTNTTQKCASNILKLIVVIFGIVNISLIHVVETLGGILPLVVSVSAITAGPLLGLFILGMLFPIANSKGALTGGITGLIFCCWMIVGHQYYNRMRLLDDFAKPTSVAGCNFFVNATLHEVPVIVNKPFVLYRISFWYHNLIGVIVTVCGGLIISWITRKQGDPPVDRNLLSPLIYFLLPKQTNGNYSADYNDIDKAFELVNFNSQSN